LGGLGVDQPRSVVDNFWLGLALIVGVTILILHYLIECYVNRDFNDGDLSNQLDGEPRQQGMI